MESTDWLVRSIERIGLTVEAYYFEPGCAFCGQWSNPVEGIIDEEIAIDNPAFIPYTIKETFNTEEFYEEV